MQEMGILSPCRVPVCQVKHGAHALVRLLLAAGHPTDMIDENGFSPLDYCYAQPVFQGEFYSLLPQSECGFGSYQVMVGHH